VDNQDTIRSLAYQLWHARGCPHGSAELDWLAAERQVTGAPASGSTMTKRDGREPGGNVSRWMRMDPLSPASLKGTERGAPEEVGAKC
jgi:hypothetical protein